MTPEELFEAITGCSYLDKLSLLSLQKSIEMKPPLLDDPEVELHHKFNTTQKKGCLGVQKKRH